MDTKKNNTCTMYDYMAKEQSMRMPPEGLVNWHPEGSIRNANVPESYNHIICALKNGKKHIMTILKRCDKLTYAHRDRSGAR